jgi:S-formylglutathione hydrolase FrmB
MAAHAYPIKSSQNRVDSCSSFSGLFSTTEFGY